MLVEDTASSIMHDMKDDEEREMETDDSDDDDDGGGLLGGNPVLEGDDDSMTLVTHSADGQQVVPPLLQVLPGNGGFLETGGATIMQAPSLSPESQGQTLSTITLSDGTMAFIQDTVTKGRDLAHKIAFFCL